MPPADKALYALRDATATVEVIPLIAASIMSKKLAESLTGLVIDVKTGAGAFLSNEVDSIMLAQTMIALGARHHCPVVVLLSNMDSPLGIACGNANEVEEAIDSLKGGGPPDLRELTLRLGTEMLLLAHAAPTAAAARAQLEQAIDSGTALEKFRDIIDAQGGESRVCDEPQEVLPQPAMRVPYLATRDGIVQRIDPRAVGKGITAMGGGRSAMTDRLDPSVGLRITVQPGDTVQRGDKLATIEARDAICAAAGRAALDAAVVIGDEIVGPVVLVSHRITAAGVELLA